MLHYAVHTGELNRVFRLLRDVLDIRITFFDLNDHELDILDVKEMSAFCRAARRSPAFEDKCRACDACHLHHARRTRQTAAYRCHAGLLEGVVPLYDPDGVYLGALLFGQLRPRDGKCSYRQPALARRFAALGTATMPQMHRYAALLQCLTQYIIRSEIIRTDKDSGIAQQVRRVIDTHARERLTLADIARLVGRSQSYVSHAFRHEYGIPPLRYARNRRLDEAADLLESGIPIQDVARQLHFCDAFHFSRAFRRRHGSPPREFQLRRSPGVSDLAGPKAAVTRDCPDS